jgi:hypothetical protein
MSNYLLSAGSLAGQDEDALENPAPGIKLLPEK